MSLGILCKRKTLLVMATSSLFAGVLVFTPLNNMFPLWAIDAGMGIAETMFHEMGHTIFSWLFGMPAIPSILTLFGRDQASGVTLTFSRIWFLQILAFAVMAYMCYRLRRRHSLLFWPGVVFSLGIIALAFTRYYLLAVLYMGNGGVVFMGGFFLFRACTYRIARVAYEHWLNAFFGFFFIFHIVHFAYKLAKDAAFREAYASPTFGGAIDNDFVQMVDQMWAWSVQGIAIATLVYAACAFFLPPLLAWYVQKED